MNNNQVNERSLPIRILLTFCPDAADVLIAMTAVNEAESAPTIVIGEDSDALILPC